MTVVLNNWRNIPFHTSENLNLLRCQFSSNSSIDLYVITISIKIPAVPFLEMDKLFLMFTGKIQRPKVAKFF